MKKTLVFLACSFIYLVTCAAVEAQTTNVTATVVDSDSTAWANGTWTLAFQVGVHQSNPAAYTIGGSPLDKAIAYQSGTANGSGVITFTNYQSTAIQPAGSSWNLVVCPNASSACATINFSTGASSLDLSSQINAAIVAPRFLAVSGAYGYNDTEAAVQLRVGNTYYNVTTPCQRLYSGISWSCTGGGNGNETPFAADLVAQCHAKCDGTTDDHVAIQACLDNNLSVMIPRSSGGPTECNVGTVGITLCSSANKSGYNALYGNGQLLGYSGSGHMITVSDACVSGNQGFQENRIQDLFLDTTGAAATTPTLIYGFDSWHFVVDNVDDDAYSGGNGYTSIEIDGSDATGGGVETVDIANYLGDGPLLLIGGSQGNCCIQVRNSNFDSLQATHTGTTVVTSTSFGDASSTNTIYDANNFFLDAVNFTGPVVFGSIDSNGAIVSTSSVVFQSSLTATGGHVTINGASDAFASSSIPVVSGAYEGTIQGVTFAAVQINEFNGLELPPFYYSVAGTPLPTCTSGLNAPPLAVSDATLATFNATYVGSGTNKVQVFCNGSNWVIY